jgi:hypothetical protein
MTDFKALKANIASLIAKADDKGADANDAMKYTQAALNVAQALYALRDISDDGGLPKN